jgi:flagellar hook-length control protein FliK
VNTIDTAPIDTSTPVQPATQASPQDPQQTGQDAAPTGVAEAFAALLAGIVATPVAPAAGTGTAIAEVAPAAETAAVATTAPPTAPVVATGTATAVPANDAIPSDGTTRPDGTAPVTTPADAPVATVGAPAEPALPAPGPSDTVVPIDGPATSGPSTTPVTPDGDTPEAPASTTGTGTTTTPAAATAPAAAPEIAAMQAAPVVAPAPDDPAPVAGDIPATVAPSASMSVAGDTTPDPGTKDGKSGSEPATQATAPAAAVPPGPDAAQPAAVTTAVDATQAPSLVVPTAVPAANAAVAATSELPQSLTTDRERFVRLVDGLEARLRVSGAEGGRAMSMTLRPAELGDVTVRLHIAADGQSATATLLAQHHQTGDLLAQAAGDLRQALADRGLRLDRFEVTAGPLAGDARNDGAPSGAPNPGKQDTRRTHYAFDARSDLAPELPGTETATGTTHEGLYVLA